MPKIKATVEILAYNNEATIEKTLASVADFDEILVIDGGSTDRTREIASRFGATILGQDARGKRDGQIADFSLIRNQGLIAAKHDWFLFVDSDEYFTPAMVREIDSIVSSNTPSHYVWKVPRRYIIDGKIIDRATTYPNTQPRFFHRGRVEKFIKPIHERIQPKSGERIGTLKNAMIVPLAPVSELRRKWARYLSLERSRLSGVSRREIIRKIFETLKTAAIYALRLIPVMLASGVRMPLRYEFLRQEYNARLASLLLGKLFTWKR